MREKKRDGKYNENINKKQLEKAEEKGDMKEDGRKVDWVNKEGKTFQALEITWFNQGQLLLLLLLGDDDDSFREGGGGGFPND